jgi:L-arabinokinase
LPTVVFYISGHGFGHASREVEVINALGAARPDLSIVIRSAVDPDLLDRSVRVPYQLLPGPCDTGVVQSSSVAHDDPATVREALSFNANLTDRADEEVRRLGRDVTVIVGDIPPIAFEVAARLRVPSLAIGNFTWDWIYEEYPGMVAAAPWLVPTIRESYRKATAALELPFAGGFGIFPSVRRIPLIARHPTRRRAETREWCGVPADRPAALLSFGGYGLPALDFASIDCRGDWTIVTTERSSAPGGPLPAHVLRLSERDVLSNGFRYEDLVAAVDVVVTKPGYGITGECVTGGTSMLYTSRGQFREYDVLVREMPRYVRARFIRQDDLFAGRWRASLTALLSQPAPPETLPTNGADVAARAIRDLC